MFRFALVAAVCALLAASASAYGVPGYGVGSYGGGSYSGGSYGGAPYSKRRFNFGELFVDDEFSLCLNGGTPLTASVIKKYPDVFHEAVLGLQDDCQDAEDALVVEIGSGVYCNVASGPTFVAGCVQKDAGENGIDILTSLFKGTCKCSNYITYPIWTEVETIVD